jgi:heat shock protein HtpX
MLWMFNNLKVVLIFTTALGLVGVVGWLMGSLGGLLLSTSVAITCGLIGWFGMDRIAIRAMKGQEADPLHSAELVAMVRRTSYEAGIPTPRIFICPHQFPNAFATGRDPTHASVAVTQGALRTFEAEALQQLIGDAINRIKRRSTLLSTFSATAAGIGSRLTQWSLSGLERRRERRT